MGSMRGEARVHINAPADTLYDLVADVTRMGEWSPETRSAEWTGGATGPAVGATFSGRNQDQKWQWAKWTGKCEVTAAERGRSFAFIRGGMGTTTWSYTFEEDASGTTVIEAFDCPKYGAPYSWVVSAKKREPVMVEGMQRTLEKLKVAAEAS